MKLVFITDQFELRTPVQQLLDRFLIGYPDEGKFYRPDCEVTLVIPKTNEAVERRVKDFGLVSVPEMPRTHVRSDGVLMFGKRVEMPPVERGFVYGALPASRPKGVISGTAVRGAWLLPGLALAKNMGLTKALAIVQGAFPAAELDALEALLPLIWERRAADAKLKKVSFLIGTDFWGVLKRDFWPLARSAISRSDTPQGDPVRDGRTQDLAGLELLEKLAKEPRAWLIEHEDGFAYLLAVLDGALADYNVALQTANGGILSAQVYRPPAPAEHHYSRLAAVLEQYFQKGTLPWPVEQNLHTLDLLQRFESTRR